MNTQQRGRLRRLIVLTAITELVGGGGLWYLVSQLGTRPDGTRITIGLPSSSFTVRANGSMPIMLSDDLKASGAEAKITGVHMEQDQTLFLLREKAVLKVEFTAGNEAIDSAKLRYVLTAQGNVIAEGTPSPAVQIAAGQKEMIEIANPELGKADRVEVRRVP